MPLLDWNHPVVQVGLQQAAQIIGTRIAGVKPVQQDTDALLRKIEDMQAQLRALKMVQESRIAQQQQLPKENTNAIQPYRTTQPAKPYSQYAPWMSNVKTSCFACGKGHLGAIHAGIKKAAESYEVQPPVMGQGPYLEARNALTDISAWLKEANRFAREDGIDHPEAQKRIEAAQEKVAEIERFVLSPERIETFPDDQKEKLESLQPNLRSLRQTLYVGIQNPKDLLEASSTAGKLSSALWGNPWLHFADEELSALLSFDWSPQALESSTPEEREKVAPLVGQIKSVHQTLRSEPIKARIQELQEQIGKIREELNRSQVNTSAA